MLAIQTRKRIDPKYLQDFRQLAHCGVVEEGTKPGHMAGWGIVLFRNGYPEYLGREPGDAVKDPLYNEVCTTIEESSPSGILMAHLRRASVGAVNKSNTHPFIYRNWALAHNGTIEEFNHPIRHSLEGTTDSERMFKLVMEQIEDGLRVEEAVHRTVRLIRERYKFTSLIFMMSDGESVYAYREQRVEPEYYTFYYTRIADGTTIFSQEPTWNAEWQSIPNGTLVVSNKDQEISTIKI